VILPEQIRAARALVGLGQAELSKLAAVGIATVKRIEASSEIRGSAVSLWKIQKALEAAGIEFIPAEAGKGPGVRLRQNPGDRQKPKAKRK
jgi:transcriptional regulator with XRE-family HTH domain